MELQIGDKVKIVDDTAQGIVRKISTHSVIVEIDGFEEQYPISSVIKIDEAFEQRFSNLNPQTVKDKNTIPKVSKRKSKNQPFVIDIHIHEILDNFNGIHKSEFLEIQLNYFERKLNEAIQKRIKKMIVIHGVGDGVLKSEVRKILSSYDNVQFFDAPYKDYGFGATQIEFYY